MGGGSYDRDVSSSSSSTPFKSSGGRRYSSQVDDIMQSRNSPASGTSIKGRRISCSHKTPISIIIDDTGSMKQDAKVIYDKLPLLWGELLKKGYVPDPSVLLCFVGDDNSDEYPFQVTNFAEGSLIDEELKKLYPEGNGGGQARESYETMAYYFLRYFDVHPGTKPILFFIADEGFYEKIEPYMLKTHLGENQKDLIDSYKVFKDLCQKFEVFLLHVPYGSGNDDKIVAQWRKVLGERVAILKDPMGVVDAMLAFLSANVYTDIDQYVVDMKNRGQDDDRIKMITQGVSPYFNSKALAVRVDDSIAKRETGADRKTKSRRL